MKKQMYYNDMIFSSKGNKIFVKMKNESKKTEYLKVNGLNILNHFNLYNRLLRHGIHNFYKVNNNIDCMVIKGKILFYNNKTLINVLELEKGSRPLRNGIVYKDEHIIYSEYYGNKNREPVNIYKYNFIENRKETLYTFADIRHIHFIQQNLHDLNKAYIGTGDFDEECGIYKFDLNKSSIEKIGGGSQIWRAVSLLQNDKDLYWGTDDPNGKNHIVRYKLDENKLEKIMEIAGPAYYSAITKNNEMCIATTIEDRRKHKAIIYKTLDGEKWDKYLEFKKDIFHTKYFGYGLVEFINNQEEIDVVVYSLNGLKS